MIGRKFKRQVKMRMLKGVNKHIIEISNTGNDCFERVILFVRPDSEGGDMQRRAGSYLAGLRLRPRMLGGGTKLLPQAAKLAAAACLGAAAAVLFVK